MTRIRNGQGRVLRSVCSYCVLTASFQDDRRDLQRFEGHGNGVLRNPGLLFRRVADSLSCMTKLQVRSTGVLGLVCVLVAALPVVAQNALPTATASGIDAAAADVLKTTGVPSASVAVVQGGKVAYVKAYGMARLNPAVAAEPGMRYSIGSVSKQFTAAVMLWLQKD